MNIYIIYKFADHQIVKEYLDRIREVVSTDCSIFIFPNDPKPKLWRWRAARKLKESQLVIFFDSLTGKGTDVGKHVSWELRKAERLGKKILVFKADPEAKERSWYRYDYSEKEPQHPKYTTVSLDNAVEYMKKQYGKQISETLLHKDYAELTEREREVLLEQYHIMIDTSEKLMERRQETVNLYTTLSTTLIAFVGTSFAFKNQLVCAMVLFVSGLLLMVLCHNWRMSLNAYDCNNTGKFMVIDTLEKTLPAEIFQCEYRYNKMNGIRSFSSREKWLPIIFFIVGIILLVAGLGLMVYTLTSSVPLPLDARVLA